MKPKSKGGDARSSNMLYIDIDKHNLIHKIFGNKTWYEIIIFMLRIAKAKHYENIEPRIQDFYKFL
jgi:hypothetical protein